ncbi:MAG: phage tail protein [Deltaproteobacteria bacterium]|nr:phage tail protein [Deltaproteobacteria bacterium]
MSKVIIYDSDLNKVAYLPDAFDIAYELRANEVGMASFSVAVDDAHVSEIAQRRYAEIYDDDRRIDLFRIVRLTKTGHTLKVECEHVLATLADIELDDTLYGSAGTATAIGEVLAEQTVTHWQLGTSDFDEQFLYEWPRGTSLLKALLDIPKRFQSGYFWTFDTSSHPWTINLVTPPTVVRAYIDYGRNMQSIEREADVTDLVTKLYPHGAKAGTDQIGITSVEPSGYAYITDYSYTTDVITRHWTNQNYVTEQELYDAATELLARQAQPKYTYRVSAADLYKITGESIDKFAIGVLVKVSNPELDIDSDVRVMSITKSDLTGKPGDIRLELANKGEEFDFTEKVNVNDLSGIDINDIPGGTPGALPTALTGTGLTITTDYLGYHVGSDWKTYMDIAGRLWADNGTQWLHWDPAATPALSIKGSVTITGGTGVEKLDDAGDLALLNVVGTAQISDLAVTDAKIDTLSVDKLTSGTLTGQYIKVLSGGYIAQNKTGYSDTTAGFYLGAGGVNALFNIGDATRWLKWTGTYLQMKAGVDTSVDEAFSKVTAASLYIDGSVIFNADGSYHNITGISDLRGPVWSTSRFGQLTFPTSSTTALILEHWSSGDSISLNSYDGTEYGIRLYAPNGQIRLIAKDAGSTALAFENWTYTGNVSNYSNTGYITVRIGGVVRHIRLFSTLG